MKTLLFFALALGFVACEKSGSEAPPEERPELIFRYGLECGWNSFGDTLIVKEDSMIISLNRTAPLPAGVPSDTVLATPPHLWLALQDSLNWQNFTALSISTYHLGYDGCDYWLKIKYGPDFHAIRYGLDDSLSSIRGLISQLDSTWSYAGGWPPF